MKKNNWIVYGLCLVASIVLLFFWYLLGLNKIDQPLDLVIAMIWWALIVVAIVLVIVLENKRKKRIRTVYVGKDFVYNNEKGVKNFSGRDQLMEAMGEILSNLQYSFKNVGLSDEEKDKIQYVVRTTNYGRDTWKGSVLSCKTKEETSFDDKMQLSVILQKFEVGA